MNDNYYRNIVDALSTLNEFISTQYPQIDEDIILNIEEITTAVNSWYLYNQNVELELEQLKYQNNKLLSILKEFNDEVDFYDDLD